MVLLVLTAIAALIGVRKAPVELFAESPVVNDVTQLNPIGVQAVVTPRSTADVVAALRDHPGPISIGGGRYSMGGQTATEGGVQLDMREMNQILAFDSVGKTITVQAGARWRQIQERIDPANLSIKIMQTYSNFTVGGSLSVNVHGRYIGLGPLVLSVRSIKLVLADGTEVEASPQQNAELFYGAIGGYGGIGVITEATLELADNVRVKRSDVTMPLTEYGDWFARVIRDSASVVFHNADIYPNEYEEVNAVTYSRTDDAVTVPERLIPKDKSYRVNRLAYRVISEFPGGKWLRQHVIDPLIFRGEPVSWRNNEASYDVADLEPSSREASTYVLQEYFVPVAKLTGFVSGAKEILNRHEVNVINISIRHARTDPGTLLAWAREEVFAFVLYYKQDTDDVARREVGVWTRELVDLAVQQGGAYYLPYQPHATPAQVAAAFPRLGEYFALKKKVDPQYRLRNTLWDTYYLRTVDPAAAPLASDERMAVDSISGYRRDEGQTFLTHPEWYIVYSSEEYAAWMKDKLPTEFPYLASIGQYWRSYGQARRETKHHYRFNGGYQVMLWVIGTSYSAELLLKALYENTIGRFSGWTAGHALTEEDRYAYEVAADYGRYIHDYPWYMYRFWPRVTGLWRDVPWGGPHLFRKWERRVFLTLEYSVKAAYAGLIGFGTKTAYTPQAERMSMVMTGWTDSVASDQLRKERDVTAAHTLVSTPRYDGFRRVVEELARSHPEVRITEVAGNDDMIVTGVAPGDWQQRLPGVEPLYAMRLPSDSTRKRVVLRVRVPMLVRFTAAVLSGNAGGLTIDHMYDY